jgi:hypothetical protein
MTWMAINACLRCGYRGLPGGTSLTKLLEEHRSVRIGRRPPDLSERQILAWADVYFAAHKKWPAVRSGAIAGTRETWSAVNSALSIGSRGLSGGLSLAELLARRRGVENHMRLPPLDEQQILAWADAYFASHGKWPTARSGPIPRTRENWSAVASAIKAGGRGLRQASSLAALLAKRRGARNHTCPPPLNEQQILKWANVHFKTTGRWPSHQSGPIAKSPGETWCAVDQALRKGRRGLQGGSSLARLLQKHGLS